MRVALATTLAVLAFVPAAAAATAPGVIAYSDLDGSLYVASLQGTNPTTLYTSDGTTTMQALDVTPDGKQVLARAYGDEAQLVLVPVAGGAQTVIAGADSPDDATLSPDGTQVVFSVDDYSSSSLAAGIYTVGVAGGTAKLVVATPSDDYDALPVYSPDGKQIAFARDAYGSNGVETVTLELVAVSGGTPKALTTGVLGNLASGGKFGFSPDGTQIAYAGDDDGPGIFTIPVAGGTPTELTSDYDYWPSWSTDGSKLFFARDATSDNASDTTDDDEYELWTVKKDGSGATLVSEGDFETLVLGGGTPPSAGSSTPPASSPDQGTSSGTTTTTTASPLKPTTPSTGKSKAAGRATLIRVRSNGAHHTVTWAGKATRWKVTLKVGSRSASALVRGTVHRHLFVLHGVRGRVSAKVVAA